MDDKIVEYIYSIDKGAIRLAYVCKLSECKKAPDVVNGLLAYRCNAHPERAKIYEREGHPVWVDLDGNIVDVELEADDEE